jgi:hypothetical protein
MLVKHCRLSMATSIQAAVELRSAQFRNYLEWIRFYSYVSTTCGSRELRVSVHYESEGELEPLEKVCCCVLCLFNRNHLIQQCGLGTSQCSQGPHK